MMLYHLYDFKEDFGFLDEDLSGHMESFFGDQLERAREILKDRKLSEIHYALESLDWMLKKGGELETYHSLEIANEKGHCYISRVKALKLLADQMDISGQTHFPNATWSDYFAVLAMAYVAEAMNPNNFSHNPQTGLKNVDWPIESMDAVCVAECFRKIEQLSQKDLSKEMSNRGKKGGRVRVAKFDELKIIVIDHYLANYQDRSNKDAGKRIYKDLKEAIDSVLSGSEPERTLEKWIGDFKNNRFTLPK